MNRTDPQNSSDESLDIELPALPPMDGADEAEAALTDEELDEILATDDDDSMDDSTGESDPVEEIETEGEAKAGESGWLDDSDESSTLDIGADNIDIDENEATADSDEPGIDDADSAFGDELPNGKDQPTILSDSGEDGPIADDEDLSAGDLPDLDSDDSDDGPSELTDELYGEMTKSDDDAGDDDDDEPSERRNERTPPESMPPWANADGAQHGLSERVWECAGAPIHVKPMRAIACMGRGVVAGGRGLVRVDLEGTTEELVARGLRGGPVTSIASSGTALLVTTEQGGLFVSTDTAGQFTEANGWRAIVSDASIGSDIEIAVAADGIWGRPRAHVTKGQGVQLVRAQNVERLLRNEWNRVVAVDDARPLHLAIDEGRLVVLVDERNASLSRTAIEDVTAVQRPKHLKGPSAGMACGFVASGGVYVYFAEGIGAFRSTNGVSWSRIDGTQSVTACAFGRAGQMIVALYSPPTETSWIAAIGEDGIARIVAELGEEADSDDDMRYRIRALAWDEMHGVLWAAGEFGLLAFDPPSL